MSRVQALLALEGLGADLKRKVFELVSFPKRADIADALKRQHARLPELAHVDEAIIDFAHDGHDPIELPGLTKYDRKWAIHRCELLGLQHYTTGGEKGKISGLLVVSKDEAWEFTPKKQAVPLQWKREREVRLYECVNCGDVSDDPQRLRYNHERYSNNI